jgi:hypothetical protein
VPGAMSAGGQILSPNAPPVLSQLPSPPDRLPPNFRPQVMEPPAAAPGDLVDVGRVWEEVGGWRHSRLEKEKGSVSPPRKEATLATSF